MAELKKVALPWLVGLPVAAGVIAWSLFSPTELPLWLTIVLWTCAAAVLGYLFYASSAWLVGPVLFYELIRGARSPRVPLLRVAYALTLLLSSFLVYLGYATGEGSERSLSAVFEGARVDPNDMAAFAGTFFHT